MILRYSVLWIRNRPEFRFRWESAGTSSGTGTAKADRYREAIFVTFLRRIRLTSLAISSTSALVMWRIVAWHVDSLREPTWYGDITCYLAIARLAQASGAAYRTILSTDCFLDWAYSPTPKLISCTDSVMSPRSTYDVFSMTLRLSTSGYLEQ